MKLSPKWPKLSVAAVVASPLTNSSISFRAVRKKSGGLVRLEPGASVGDHSHKGDEDFYFCISGTGIVVDNGVEHPFIPGTLQITRDGESQAIRNTGETELVFLGALVATIEI